MNKETLKLLWEIYNELMRQQNESYKEDYYMFDLSEIIKKIKIAIDAEIK